MKWRGVPVWSDHGIICTGETYKATVKMTFARGASLKDPTGLFNSSLDGNTRRAIDIREGDPIAEKALKNLIAEAVALNRSLKKIKSSSLGKAAKSPQTQTRQKKKPSKKTGTLSGRKNASLAVKRAPKGS